MPIYGKFGDLWGRRGCSSSRSPCSLSPARCRAGADFAWLVAWRGVQGLGGGGLMILSQAIIADIVPARERAKYMGPIGALFGLSAVAGPLVGGFFTDPGLGWRWAFWINVPVGIAALFIGWFALTLPRKRRSPPIDYAGHRRAVGHHDVAGPVHRLRRPEGWTAWPALAARRARRLGGRVRRRRAAGGRADHPDAPVPQPHLRRRHRARHGGRPGHVLGDRLRADVPADELRALGGGSGLLMLPMVGRNHPDHPELGAVHRAHRPVQDRHRRRRA